MKDRVSIAFLCLTMATTPTLAMHCAQARTRLERRICSDARLSAADRTMGKAYFTLLHAISDPSMRTSLIQSQRRWLAARESDLGNLADQDDIDERTLRNIVLTATQQRTKNLRARSDGRPLFVARMLKQRALAGAYSGGRFAGYQVRCTFIPEQRDSRAFQYDCFGSHAYQNGDRVCAESNDFASYTLVTTRAIGNVENRHLKPVASCAFGGNDRTCPDDRTDSTRAWNTHPTEQQFQAGYGDGPRLDVDPDLPNDDDDQAWYRRCLTEPSYPLSSPGTASSGKRSLSGA